MALIICPECGKKVSDQAEICVNCGFKIQGTKDLEQLSQKKSDELDRQKKEKNNSIVLSIIAVAIVIFIGGFIWYQSTEDERARKRLQDNLDDLKQRQEEIDDLERQLEYNKYLIDEYEDNN